MPIIRTGPLTWGQHLFWFHSHTRPVDGVDFTPRLSFPLNIPKETPAAAFREVVNKRVNQFEALRTIYSMPRSGPPQQCVLDSYEPPLLGLDEAARFCPDILKEPGIRFVVRESGDRIHDASFVMRAVDVDAFGMFIVKGLIEHDLDGRGSHEEINPNYDFHPIDWARRETDRLAERNTRTLRWMREFRSGVPRNYLALEIGRQRVVITAQVPDMLVGLEELARHHQVNVGTIIHALITVVLAAWADRQDIYLQTVTTNRWQPETRGMVGRVATTVPCRITADPTWPTGILFRQAHRSLLAAYRHSQHDFGASRMDGVKQDADFGSTLALPVVVDYYGFARTRSGSGNEMRYAVRSTVYESGINQIRFDIIPVWPGILLRATLDTDVISVSDADAFGHMLTDLIWAAIRQPGILVSDLMRAVSLPSINHMPCSTMGESRFSLKSIRARLLECSEVSEAAVFLDDHGELPVRAHIAGQRVNLIDLHERMLLAAADNPLLHVPAMYRQVNSSPADPASEESWLNMKATASLRPRTDYRRLADEDERIRLMVEVFERCHPGVTCDPARCYAQADGDYLMVPAMLARLADVGLTGAGPADFVGLASLAAIACKLTLAG
jgi:hypothetical protein